MPCLPHFHFKTCGDNAGLGLAVSGVLRTSAFFSPSFFLSYETAAIGEEKRWWGPGQVGQFNS